jgi:hypothetical protein
MNRFIYSTRYMSFDNIDNMTYLDIFYSNINQKDLNYERIE